MENKIRPSKQFINLRLFNKYSTHKHINNPELLVKELSEDNNNDQYILSILKAIVCCYTDRNQYKELITKYNVEIKKISKLLLNKPDEPAWNQIVRSVEFYITYKKHMANYLRNKSIILFFVTMEPPKVSTLLNLYLSHDGENLDPTKNYFIRDIKELMVKNVSIQIDRKLASALIEYSKLFENGDKLYDINTSRMGKIVENITGRKINEIRNIYFLK